MESETRPSTYYILSEESGIPFYSTSNRYNKRVVSEILAFIRTDGQTDMARSTRLVIQIKNMYTFCGQKRLLLPVAYFPTSLVFPSFLSRLQYYLGLKSKLGYKFSN